jgi:hypothetical protein
VPDPGQPTNCREEPAACSLGAGELGERLAAIAALGSESLVSHEQDGIHHLLRFEGGPAVRRRLEEIVAAESECCPFLALGLDERNGLLVLSISAPEEAQPVADELAAVFTRPA